ncbi:MAG: hypothetical protein ACYDAN_08120 [Candidatus Limnocylindrales bacterium]
MIPRTAALGVALVVAALSASAPITLARFAATRASSEAFSTATLKPPTQLLAAGGASASLTWTTSTSSSATGYQLLRSATSGGGYAQVKTVTPISASSTVDSPGTGVWYYVLDTYAASWTSALSNEASVTIGQALTTPYAGCSNQAPETVNAGDNNGYETSPASGCAKDNVSAVDKNSGTDTVLDCADPGKDREQFWGYAFGLPGTVSSVSGVSLQLDMGLGNRSGTSQVCAQLSWDGGTSWTAARTVELDSVPTATYTLGSSTDDWGHAGWTAAQLSAANFRVRLTDMSTNASKDFELDSLGASVAYMP